MGLRARVQAVNAGLQYLQQRGLAWVDPGEYVLGFGKYKGMKLKDIGDDWTLQHYLKWSGLRPKVREVLEEFLAGREGHV